MEWKLGWIGNFCLGGRSDSSFVYPIMVPDEEQVISDGETWLNLLSFSE